MIGDDGEAAGVLTSEAIEHAIAADRPATQAEQLARTLPSLSGDDTLEQTLHAFVLHGVDELPVRDADGNLVGWISRSDLLHAYSRRASGRGSGQA